MKKLFFILLFSVSSLFSQENGNLTITSENFKSDTGYAIIRLFEESANVMGKQYNMQVIKIKNKKAKWEFKNIAFGSYAAYVFHDTNSNKEVDHNFFRFPSEPMAFSGKYKISIFSGKPTFDKMKFEFNQDNTIYKIDFKN